MAKLGTLFNVDEYPEEQGPKKTYDDLPEGDYDVIVLKSDVVADTKMDRVVKVTFKITNGAHKGRYIFQTYTIDSKTAEYQRGGRREFASLLRACGKKVVDDSKEIVGIPLTVMLGYRTAKSSGKRYTKIEKHSPALGRTAEEKAQDAEITKPWDDSDDIPY